jgi:Insertion element 4 transposase N-terminal/Transposase DDE domain
VVPGDADSGASSRLTDHVALGVLRGLIRRDLVDEVIAECGRREKRSRLLPAHVVVYYVLALNLFFGEAYEEVMRRLVAGLQFLRNWEHSWRIPTTSAISQARARLGEMPLKRLYERVAVPMGGPGIPGARFAGLRVMAMDGVVLEVPDTPENDEEFGRMNNGPFPQVRVVGLGECGTHAIVAARLGSATTYEQPLAAELMTELESDMLVLADRGFYSHRLWHSAQAHGAELLWRVSATLKLPVRQVLPDGSYLSFVIDNESRGRMRRLDHAQTEAWIAQKATTVRVIEYQVEQRETRGEVFCLITTLLDHTTAPAVELAALYHRRWEFELSLNEIETHQLGHNRVLRSKTPELVKQEIWSLLLTHYAIRCIMKQAADTVEYDAERISFIRSVRAIRRQVNGLAGFSP